MLNLRIILCCFLAMTSFAFAETELDSVSGNHSPKEDMIRTTEQTDKGFYADDAMFIIPLEDGTNNQSYSAVKGILNGNHPPRINTRSHMSYYIISGECHFTLAHSKISAQKGEFITIKPNTPYAMDGKACEMFMLTNPPFDRKYDKLVDSL